MAHAEVEMTLSSYLQVKTLSHVRWNYPMTAELGGEAARKNIVSEFKATLLRVARTNP